MKKSKILYFVLMLNFGLLFSQINVDNIQIDYGTEIEDTNGDIVKIIGEASNVVYTLALKGKDEYYLKTFNSKDLSEKTKTKIVLPEYKDKDLEFEDVYMIDDIPYIIGSTYTNKTKTFNLLGFKLSPDGKMDQNGIVLFESEVEKRALKGAFYFKQSPDEKTLLILHTATLKKQDAVKYEVKLFDKLLKPLMDASEIVKFDDSKKKLNFNIADFDVNNKDDVFIVINENYYENKNTVQNFYVNIYKNNTGYKKENVNINFKGKKVVDCDIMATHNDFLQLTGFYSDLNAKGKALYTLEGIYMISVDILNNTSKDVVFSEFDYNTKVKLIGERKAKKGKDLYPYYNNIYTIEKEDGGLIILSEYSVASQGTGGGIGIGGLGVSVNTYNIIKNEIIVTSLNPDGSLSWTNVLPKEQDVSITTVGLSVGGYAFSGGSFGVGMGVSVPITFLNRGPEYMSCLPIYKNGVLKVIINDGEKNKGITNIDEVKDWGNYNNSTPSVFVFDKTGKMSRVDSEQVKTEQLVVRPLINYRKTDNEIIVYGSRKSKNKLGRLYIK